MENPPVVIVLAGGANSRFWPLEQKTLFEFMGESLLARHIRILREMGCQDFILIANPDNAALLSGLVSALPGINAVTVTQERPLGMGDALMCAEPLLREKFAGRALYVTQAHDVADSALHSSMLGSYGSGSADGYLPARYTENYFPGGYLTLDGERVAGIIEKPGEGREPSKFTKLVADIFCAWEPMLDATHDAASSGGDDVYERALGKLLPDHVFEAVHYDGQTFTMKYPWDVLDVMDYFLSGDFVMSRITNATGGKSGHIHVGPGVRVPNDAAISGTVYMAEGVELGPGVIIQGPVFLDRGVRLSARTTVLGPAYLGPKARLFPGALVNGPAFLGEEAKVGNNALVRASMVGGGSEVGFSTEVARSYVGKYCELHTNYVGDSILAEGVHMGSGAVTANLKLNYRNVGVSDASSERGWRDTGRQKLGMIAGSYAQVGINGSIMPGQRIGRDAIVGAAVVLDHDLMDNRFARIRWDENGTPRLEETDAPVKRSEIMKKQLHL